MKTKHNWSVSSWLRAFVCKWLGLGPVVVRARAMSDVELLACFDVAEDHAVLQGVLELIARGKDQCLGEAGASVACERETAFYLGGRYGLEQLETYMVNLRAEAVRKRSEV